MPTWRPLAWRPGDLPPPSWSPIYWPKSPRELAKGFSWADWLYLLARPGGNLRLPYRATGFWRYRITTVVYGGLLWRSVYRVDPLSTEDVRTGFFYRGFISTASLPLYRSSTAAYRSASSTVALPLYHATASATASSLIHHSTSIIVTLATGNFTHGNYVVLTIHLY